MCSNELFFIFRGPNVSILHLRSTSEPWETSPTSAYPPSVSSGSSRSYPGVKTVLLTKHQSLGSSGNPPALQQRKQTKDESTFFSSGKVNSQELYVSGMCSRELSPVRWCDQEVDGVYLGRSGWVQVQQRSLDDNRRHTSYSTSVTTSTTSSLPQYKRPGIKLADYHCNSEPSKISEMNRSLELQRPAYLPLKTRDIEYISTTPSPHSIPESFSPPPVTPIISPPPAFQDRVKSKSRMVYGKPPFLPRSDAIVDSDVISPPATPPPPPVSWTLPETRQTSIVNISRKPKLTPSPVSGHPYRQHSRIPQTKSLEEATNRRSQFLQRYKDSSSSSSSSLGFRSLDSCVSRPVMPRLAEHSGSIDTYEDADEEDNNSSSLNISNVSSIILNSSPDSVVERGTLRDKASPSGRTTRLIHHRPQSRRSPSSSDVNKQVTCSSPSSSSSSSSGFPSRSPSNSGSTFRRSTPSRQHTSPHINIQDDLQRVRRSRSLQLPEKRSPSSAANVAYREHLRVSPQQHSNVDTHRVIVKMANSVDRPKKYALQPHPNDDIDEDMLREAEVVTEFLYGTRSRAAAKALLLQRCHDRWDEAMKETQKATPNNGYNVYFVGNKMQRQKPLQRGSSVASMQPPPNKSFTPSPTTESKNPCNSSTCDFWPHCAQRDNLNSQAQNVYAGSVKVSPTYQRSPQSDHSRTGNSTPEPNKKRSDTVSSARASPESKVGSFLVRRPPTPSDRHLSVEQPSEVCDQYVRELSVCRRGLQGRGSMSKREMSSERKTSPVNLKSSNRSPSLVGNSSCSSSSSDIWITTSDRTITKSPRNTKSSGASTPMDEPLPCSSVRNELRPREMILTRPGSAPVNVEDENVQDGTDSQKRSMSLPKSFLSGRSKQR